MNYAVILAGGRGVRTGNKLPKQFCMLDDKPIIAYSIDAFSSVESVDVIIVACNSEYIKVMDEIALKYFPCPDRVRVVNGGDSRGGSLVLALESLSALDPAEEDKVLIHEAARPGLTKKVIKKHLEQLDIYGATNTLGPVVDLMVTSKNGHSIDTALSKREVFHGQAPQGYRVGELLEFTCRSEVRRKLQEDMDLCELYLNDGRSVGIVIGGQELTKITFEHDVEIVKMLLRSTRD